MPTVLSFFGTGRQEPRWIALDEILLPNGELKPDDELPYGVGVGLKTAMRSRPNPVSGCIEWRVTMDYTPRTELGSALMEAKSVLQATKTGVSPGLWIGSLGNLFRVQIDEVLKDLDSRLPTREHYVFLHAGEIQLQGRRFCIHDGAAPRQMPKIGDQVLLLTNSWDPSHEMVNTGESSGFIGLTREGRTLMPVRYLRTKPALAEVPVDEFLVQVRQKLRNTDTDLEFNSSDVERAIGNSSFLSTGNTLTVPEGLDEFNGTRNLPIIVDLGPPGIMLTSPSDGVPFDIDTDFEPENVAWTAEGSPDAFLCRDLNNDGLIESGRELFSSVTSGLLSGQIWGHGYKPLAEFDSKPLSGNENGFIDLGDIVYDQLLLWVDSNHNGTSESGELFSLAEVGVERISIHYQASEHIDEHANEFRLESRAWIRVDSQLREVNTAAVFLRSLD